MAQTADARRERHRCFADGPRPTLTVKRLFNDPYLYIRGRALLTSDTVRNRLKLGVCTAEGRYHTVVNDSILEQLTHLIWRRIPVEHEFDEDTC